LDGAYVAGHPAPVGAETALVPADHGLRLDDDDRFLVLPGLAEFGIAARAPLRGAKLANAMRISVLKRNLCVPKKA